MSKKNSNVILKNNFKDYEDISHIYSVFKNKLKYFKKKVFLIAVSGGPDSLALTALAKSFSNENKCKIYYVLVDHNLRKNSSSEAISVKKLLNKYKISLNVLKNKKLIKKNIQSEARIIRYDLLTSFCKKRKIKTILTAHNLEDQVETFFIRLSRGSGLDGLSSMKEVNKISKGITLVRPLLDFKKKQLIRISKIIFGKFYQDPTNKNKKYLRTRIRNLQKLPSRDTLDIYFNKIYQKSVFKKKKKLFINIKILNNLNKEMKMRIFKKSIQDFTNTYYALRSKKIFNLIYHIETTKNAKFTLGGCLILREKNHIILEKEIKNK